MMAIAAMSDRKAVAAKVAARLGLTTTTLYSYINGVRLWNGLAGSRRSALEKGSEVSGRRPVE